jgi:hypothetical protein
MATTSTHDEWVLVDQKSPVNVDPVQVTRMIESKAASACTLCLNSTDERCFVTCAEEGADEAAACTTVTNTGCGHGFHMHCFQRIWLKTKNDCTACPACEDPWTQYPAVSSRVQTPQGPGEVVEYRAEDGVFKVLLDWQLAPYSPHVYSFCELADLRPDTPLEVDTVVVCPQGRGTIVEYRPADGIYKVELEWKLAPYSPHVYSYVQRGELRQEPVLIAGARVITPQGAGSVVEYRAEDKMYKIQTDWSLAYDNHVFTYMTRSGFVALDKGHLVDTPYGRGAIVEWRHSEGLYKVQLDWELAYGQHVYVFIAEPTKWTEDVTPPAE